MSTDRVVAVSALLDVGPGDEAGTPDAALIRCACGTLYRRGDETHPDGCPEAGR